MSVQYELLLVLNQMIREIVSVTQFVVACYEVLKGVTTIVIPFLPVVGRLV